MKAVGSSLSGEFFFLCSCLFCFCVFLVYLLRYINIELIVLNKIYRSFDRSDRPLHVKFFSKRISFARGLALNTEEKSLRPFWDSERSLAAVEYSSEESHAYAITKCPYQRNNLVAETLLPESFACLFDPLQTFINPLRTFGQSLASRVFKNRDLFGTAKFYSLYAGASRVLPRVWAVCAKTLRGQQDVCNIRSS